LLSFGLRPSFYQKKKKKLCKYVIANMLIIISSIIYDKYVIANMLIIIISIIYD